jgi:hypothetical protein
MPVPSEAVVYSIKEPTVIKLVQQNCIIHRFKLDILRVFWIMLFTQSILYSDPAPAEMYSIQLY